MSSQLSNAQAQQELSLIFIAEYEQIAAFTLVFYDYLISFRSEIGTIWRRPFTVTSILYLSTRWNTIAIFLAQYTFPNAPTSDCSSFYHAEEALFFLAYMQANVFTALRIYAIWGRNMCAGLVMLLLGSIPGLANLYISIFRSTYLYASWPANSCAQTLDMSPGEVKIWFGSWNGYAMATLGLTLALIMLKTYCQWRDAARANIHISASICILRDGVLFFAACFVIAVLKSALPSDPYEFDSILSTLLPMVLMSRFILNLRSLGNAPPDLSLPSGAHHTSRFTAVRFCLPHGRSLLGNMGEDLTFGEEDADEYAETTSAAEEAEVSTAVERSTTLKRRDIERGSISKSGTE